MTVRGFCVTLLELLLLILALGTEIREFFVVALCIGGVVLYSLISLLLASFTLSVESKLGQENTLRGDETDYTFRLKGVALLPVTGYLSVKSTEVFDKKMKRHKHSFVMLPSFSASHNFHFELPCLHVGKWEVGIRKLRFEDLFGLFSLPLLRTTKADYRAQLSIMPRIHKLESEAENSSSGDFGSTSLMDAEDGELLGDSRQYREGDTLKRINWKMSARTKTLYSRQFEMPQKPKIMIAADCAIMNKKLNDTVDIICETAISLAKYYTKQSYIVELVTLRDKKYNANHAYSLLESKDVVAMQQRFTDIEFYNTEDELYLSQITDGQLLNCDRLYFITDCPSAELLSRIADYSKSGKMAYCVLPKVLEELPEAEAVEEFEEEYILSITSADSVEKKAGVII